MVSSKFMKDQNTISDHESQEDKWRRAQSLFIESLLKPDPQLRGCAHNQKCFNELISIRDQIVDKVKLMEFS